MRTWEESLRERLSASPEYAAEYLNAVLEENDPQAFLLALRHVADANGGVSKLATDAELSRESLYRTLSETGNPKLTSLTAVLGALGMQLAILPKKVA
jgi:probable addiction module antidote protein